jgi:hypothetical protein
VLAAVVGMEIGHFKQITDLVQLVRAGSLPPLGEPVLGSHTMAQTYLVFRIKILQLIIFITKTKKFF